MLKVVVQCDKSIANTVGTIEGIDDGFNEGLLDCTLLGSDDGALEGLSDGIELGKLLTLGFSDGIALGF